MTVKTKPEQIISEETPIERFIAVLNEAFTLDPRTIKWLGITRFPCNDKLSEHHTIQTKRIQMNQPMGSGVVRYEVGLLDILNGIFSANIVPKIDDSGKMVGFEVLKIKNDEQ